MQPIFIAFVQLVHSFARASYVRVLPFGNWLRRHCYKVYKILTGRFGFLLANVATVIATIITVAQYQFFEQIPETKAYICGNATSEQAFRNLLGYSDKIVFVDFRFDLRCDDANIQYPDLEVVTAKVDHLFTIFSFPRLTPYPTRTNIRALGSPEPPPPPKPNFDESPRPYEIRLMSEWSRKPFRPREKLGGMVTLDPFLIRADVNDSTLVLTLIPAPKNETLLRQLKCREKSWSKFWKAVRCPFIRVEGQSDTLSPGAEG